MKTKYALIILVAAFAATLLTACAAHSQRRAATPDSWTPAALAKLDLPARMLVDSLATNQKSTPRTVSVMVSLAEGAKASALTDAGFNVRTDLGTMAVVSVATDSLSRLAAMPQIKSVAIGTPQNATIPNEGTQQIKTGGKAPQTGPISIQ